jgi:hypothetical protein
VNDGDFHAYIGRAIQLGADPAQRDKLRELVSRIHNEGLVDGRKSVLYAEAKDVALLLTDTQLQRLGQVIRDGSVRWGLYPQVMCALENVGCVRCEGVKRDKWARQNHAMVTARGIAVFQEHLKL